MRIENEVRITLEPQRADAIVHRRQYRQVVRRPRVLRRLWKWLGRVAIVEFKSKTKRFRRGDFARLLGYGAQYHSAHITRLTPQQLTLVLVVPSLTRTLRQEVQSFGYSWVSLGGGYHRLDGATYPTYIVSITRVADMEKDARLSLFGNHPQPDLKAYQWFQGYIMAAKPKIEVEKLPGYDECVRWLRKQIPREEWLKGLTPRQRLEGLTPRKFVEGLTVQQRTELARHLGMVKPTRRKKST